MKLLKRSASNPLSLFVFCVLVLPIAPPCFAQALLPNFSTTVFERSLNIDNQFFPLVPGTIYTYDTVKTDPDTGVVETVLVIAEVLSSVKKVAGVDSRIVRDREWQDGLLVEEAFDWYAQDNAGNVWNMGEDTTDFIYDDLGNLIEMDKSGSWEVGVAGAAAGYKMKSTPQIGDNYAQEFAAGVAADEAKVLGLGETHTVPYGTFSNVLRTQDTSPLDPTDLDHNFYAPGVGRILRHKLDVDTGAIYGMTTLRSVSVVPEPGAATLLLSAVVGLFAGLKRRLATLR